MSAESWPVARFGPVARLRVLAAGLPGAVLHERTLAAPFERVWGYFADMERSTPEFDDQVGEFRVLRRDGHRLVARVRSSGWPRAPITLDVDLEPGWCWMAARPRLFVVGFAAEPEGGSTRFAHLEGLTFPGPPALQAVARPLLIATRRLHRSHVPADVDGIERALGLRNE
jgi:hypothetical protein